MPMSKAASESEDWLASHFESSGHIDDEFIRIISKAVEELDLEWSPPADPEHSRLNPRSAQQGSQDVA